MKPSPFLRGFALVVVILGYAALFGALLVDTWDADKAFEPDDFTSTITPLLSGALGLVLAVSLGVEAKAAGATAGFLDRLKALFKTEALLLAGAIIYLASGIAGGVVWRVQEDITPDLVTAVVLTVAGYLVATVTALARQ